MQKGDLRNARDLFSETVRAAPQMSRARNDLAWVLAELNEDLDRALDLAREARADLSDNPAVADTLGWVYMKRDLPGAALVEFDAAIELSQAAEEPSADYHYHRGLALEELNRPREAAASYDRALALEPDHAAARSASARVSAMSQASQG
jgi:tetratricopeptide (TPR) repeat protein